ncbi:MAG: hypothetical protein WA655_20670 [Candidatus Korobacteraceae bacterium]
MRIHRVLRVSLLVLMLFATVTTSLAASNGAAVLNSSGAVVVNGGDAPKTTALFKGDTVHTTGGALVTISSPGSTVLLPQNSQVVFQGNVLGLEEGTASVSTTTGMTIQANQYSIAPAAGGTAKYEIRKSGNSILVHASSGALTINASGKPVSVAQGATITLTSGVVPVPTPSEGSFFKLNKALSSQEEVPFCTHVGLCVNSSSVSGQKPCRCRHL